MTILTRTRTAADVIVAALQRHGITDLFGQSLPSTVFLAAEEAGLRQVVYRTENAGGAMADGFARVSNRITVVGAQNGPAATLLVPPMAEALKASTPMLSLVLEVPASKRDKNAFQELDHFALFAGVSKWTRRLDDPDRADEYLDMAIVAATSGRPGPVVLLLPADVLEAPTDRNVPARHTVLGHYPLDRPRPDGTAVAEAAALLAKAERPIVIAGGGVNRSDAAQQLAAFQQASGIPVATTPMGKGAIDETNELSVGVVGNYMGTNSATKYLRSMVTGADVVLLVGTRTNENGTDGWSLLPRGAELIHVDIDGQEVGRNYEGIRLVGDAGAALADLTMAIQQEDLTKRRGVENDVKAAIAIAREEHRRESARVREAATTPIRPERVVAELDQLIDENTILVADASYSSNWIGNYITSRRAGQKFLLPRGLAGLGWGFPMALGAQVAEPESKVVVLSGDGGFGHVWAELETAVRERLPIVSIVLNNSILGYQKHGENYLFGAHTSAVDFQPVDHAAIARAVGAEGVRISDPAELAPALAGALASDLPTLIEIMTDPTAYPPITAWDGKEEALLKDYL
ncbi:acetolactate synthase catalytic subunit [Georgenia sp. SYP-B2076]|uniref:acetolactate synthase catalytic subunit n=1 Tax=Georgenia sp. SYP-B2076 TaxID=2495881 RepID=UPI000F8F472F|nr:acetolactate synthase catalytic subunit [Georgenia sp. SYP-B2076]